ncbi:MAG: hypothetical protein R6U67_14295 [Sodalinema sp.]
MFALLRKDGALRRVLGASDGSCIDWSRNAPYRFGPLPLQEGGTIAS